MIQHISSSLFAAFVTTCLALNLQAADSIPETAQWIWAPGEIATDAQIFVRQGIRISEAIQSARITATADNHCQIFCNGKQVATSDDWGQLSAADLSKVLKPGNNVIAIAAQNDGGPAGLIAQLHAVTRSGKVITLGTDASWKVTAADSNQSPGKNWKQIAFDDKSWLRPQILGPLGAGNLPWSNSVGKGAIASMLSGKLKASSQPLPAGTLVAKDGFRVEKIFQVPRSMGSWVSITTDDRGRLIASDQGGAGLYLITPAALDDPQAETKVEKLPVEFSSAQGMVWAFDSLYAMVNGKDPGLYRLTDTDRDGLLDKKEFLMPVPGGGEHGPHGIVLSPDGKSLYVTCGNHTNLPKDIAGSRVPSNWGEDHLLPRRWDANGHAAGKLAPGGWIAKVDPTGKQWEIVSMGYRNQYDIAFNSDRELFTYDADMEWDLGSPWYRPTRVCHVVSGSEFGWRSGTGKWPTHYEDSLPPVIDIGPGSPVGVVFGYGAKFPAKYQRALYLLDWTYSTIYAVHLTPQGSTYTATKEDFVYGSPLNVTDAIIGHDGAMYFTIGGRGTQSALYRVVYEGDSAPAKANDLAGEADRKRRRQLESMHDGHNFDKQLVLKSLNDPDRFIRYAARIALEHQPVGAWRSDVLKISQPQAALMGLMALARHGKPTDLSSVLTALNQLDWSQLNRQQRLTAARVYQLACVRLGQPSGDLQAATRQRLAALFPAHDAELDVELAQLLIYFKSPSVVAKTLDLMASYDNEPVPDWSELAKRNRGYGGTVQRMMDNMPPMRAINLAFHLRNATDGWTLADRERYFKFFLTAAKHPGGNSYAKFLTQFRDDALKISSPAEKVVLDPIAGQSLVAAPIQSTPPKGPGRKWTRNEALQLLSTPLSKRNYDAGRNLFHATSCAKCHRYNGEGGAVGPDLSTAGRKYQLADLLDNIITPSKVISDQYGSHQVLTSDGKSLVGRAVEVEDKLYVYTIDADAPPQIIPKEDVEAMQVSKVSQMPVGLIDPLSAEELKDLIAYLLSGGNRRHAVYR